VVAALVGLPGTAAARIATAALGAGHRAAVLLLGHHRAEQLAIGGSIGVMRGAAALVAAALEDVMRTRATVPVFAVTVERVRHLSLLL